MVVSLLALPLLVWQRSLVDSVFWPMGDWENWNIQKGDVWIKQRKQGFATGFNMWFHIENMMI